MTDPASAGPRTLFEKVWESHVVVHEPEHPAVLYIDLHLIHEVTSPQAFAMLAERGLKVRRPDRTLAVMDHSTPTDGKTLSQLRVVDEQAANQLERLAANCEAHGIELHAYGSQGNGIVHVVGPERGRTQPGMTIVCGDSHTSTHGAFGALAFGIGTSEVGHVFATQTLLQEKPKSFAVNFVGEPGPGITAKDLILALIAEIGVGGGTGYVLEYRGPAVEALSMDGRMTLCNMSIEAGARAGMVAPDEVTFAYLAERPDAPKGEAWEAALERWRTLPSDVGAVYDREVTIDVSTLAPMITWGTNPGMGMPIDAALPTLDDAPDDATRGKWEKAYDYVDLEPGAPILGQSVDVVFIGSCTNSRLSDLRDAARVLAGRSIAEGVHCLIVPGSYAVKQAAEAEGLHEVFLAAGAEWREPGCSMCIAMNGDKVGPGQYAVSTSNRNFEGRQGAGSRTFLASPLTAAASAVSGEVTDPRKFL